MIRINPDSSIEKLNSSSSSFDSVNSVCSCKEVLIVDDEPFNILAIKTLLKRFNINLDEVNILRVFYFKTTSPIEAV